MLVRGSARSAGVGEPRIPADGEVRSTVTVRDVHPRQQALRPAGGDTEDTPKSRVFGVARSSVFRETASSRSRRRQSGS